MRMAPRARRAIVSVVSDDDVPQVALPGDLDGQAQALAKVFLAQFRGLPSNAESEFFRRLAESVTERGLAATRDTVRAALFDEYYEDVRRDLANWFRTEVGVVLSSDAVVGTGGLAMRRMGFEAGGVVTASDAGSGSDGLEVRRSAADLAKLPQKDLVIIVLSWLLAILFIARLAYDAEPGGQSVFDSVLSDAPGWFAMALAITWRIQDKRK